LLSLSLATQAPFLRPRPLKHSTIKRKERQFCQNHYSSLAKDCCFNKKGAIVDFYSTKKDLELKILL
jgi:hypothetical protein